jgi:D-serine deaminase-like pyridoxal phosphate-dependent protein
MASAAQVAPFPGLEPARYALPERELARLFSPALVIHLDLVRANVRRVIGYAGSAERWRPHVKTTKTPAVFAELLAAGVRQFKCATLREARCLLATARAAGADGIDLLIAYPLIGPALGELARLAAEHPAARLSVLCEDAALVARVPAAAGIFVDVDPGMGRTGIALDDTGAIRAVARAAGGRFRGLHHYEGHLHGELDERRERCFTCYRALLALAEQLVRAGSPAAELITSGTPAFLHALAFPGFRSLADAIHRVSPGTVVLHDLGAGPGKTPPPPHPARTPTSRYSLPQSCSRASSAARAPTSSPATPARNRSRPRPATRAPT